VDIQYNQVTGQFEDELGNIYSASAASDAANRGDSSTIIGSSTTTAPRLTTNSSTTTGQSPSNSTFASGYSPVPIAGIYGAGGPGHVAKVQAKNNPRAAYEAIVAASAAIDTPGEFTKVLNDAYVALKTVEDLQLYRSLVWTAEQDARAKLDTLIRDGAEQKKIDFARDQYNDALKASEDFNRRLEDAQAASLEIQQEVSQNVPKGFARDFAAQNNKAPLAYTDTFADKAVDAGLAGIGSLAGGLYRGAHAVGSNLPVVGDFVGDAIEGVGEWFQTTPGVIAGTPTGVQGQWGSIPPWMPTSQVNVLGQIPGSATNVGTMTGTILDTINAVRNGQITLAEAIEEGGLTELATVLGVSDLALQAAALAGKTIQDVISEASNVTNSVAQQTQNQQPTTETDSDLDVEGGTTFGGFTADENLATQIIEGNVAAEEAAAAAKLLADQQAALAKATKVFEDAGGGAAGTAAVLEALEANGLTVKDLADQTGLSLAELNTFIGANTTAGTYSTTTGTGTDTTTTGTGTDTTTTGTGTDITTTGTGADTVTGGGGADTVTGGGGADTVTGGGGADTVVAGGGADTVVAGGGADTVVAGGGADTVVAGGGADTLTAADTLGTTEIIVGGTDALTAAADAAGATEIIVGGTDALTAADTLGATEIIVGGTEALTAANTLGATDITVGGTEALTAAADAAGATEITVGGTDTVVAGGGTDTLTAADTLGATEIIVGGTEALTAADADTGATEIIVGGTEVLTAAADAAGATEITVGGTDTVVAGGGTDTLTAADTLGATEITVGGTEALTAADADTGATEIIVGGTEVLTAAGEDELKKITLSEAPALAAGEDELKKITLSEAPALTAGADELTEISLNETPALTAGADELTEISLNETPALTAGEDEVPGLIEVLAFPDTPGQIISQGGMESVSTEKAGLAKINALYNPALSLEENLALLRRAEEEEEEEEEEDIVGRALYYGGGRVQSSNIVDRISSILGGY
jgi:hypothetical protein